MLFNSLEFAAFLPIAFLLYWLVCGKSGKAQNLCLVALSAVFYGWWDWRFLFLIAFTALCTWASGIAIARGNARSRGGHDGHLYPPPYPPVA